MHPLRVAPARPGMLLFKMHSQRHPVGPPGVQPPLTHLVQVSMLVLVPVPVCHGPHPAMRPQAQSAECMSYVPTHEAMHHGAATNPLMTNSSLVVGGL